MVKQRRGCQSLFYCFERTLQVVVPREYFSKQGFFLAFFCLWAFEGVEEWVEMVCRTPDEPPVIIYHTKEPLKFLDGGWCGDLLDCFYACWQRGYAICIDVISEEL